MTARLLILSILGMLAGSGFASAQGKADKLPADLAIVPADAVSFFHVRPIDLVSCDMAAKLRKIYPNEFAQMEAALQQMPGGDSLVSISFASFNAEPFVERKQRNFREEKKDKKAEKKKTDKEDADSLAYIAIFTNAKAVEQDKVIASFLGEKIEDKLFNGKVYFVSKERFRDTSLHFLNENTYIAASPPEGIKKILGAQPAGAHPLKAALELARNKLPLVGAVNLASPRIQADKKRLLADWKALFGNTGGNIVAGLPPSLMPLLDMDTAIASLGVGDNVRIDAKFTFPTPQKAAAAMEPVQDAVMLMRTFSLSLGDRMLRSNARNVDNPLDYLFWSLVCRHAEAAFREAIIDRRQQVIQLQIQCQFDFAGLRDKARAELKALENDEDYRQGRLRRQSGANMLRMAQALHSFDQVHNNLPPAAICSKKDGKPLLSWRVAILPQLGEDKLYKEFKLDEPWDGPNNIKLLPRMPKVYEPVVPVVAEPFSTFYQTFTGPGTVLDYKVDAKETLGAKGLNSMNRDNNLWNKICVVEAADAVPWTKPAELVYDKKKPLPKLGGGLFPDGFNVVRLNRWQQQAEFMTDDSNLRYNIEVTPRK